MIAVRRLKKLWYAPAETALLNSFRLVIKPREMIILVIVVPTLAPMMIGTAFPILMAPEAVSATAIDVVAELLWTIAVISKPMKKPVKGLEVASMMVSAAVCPNNWRDEIIRSRAKRKISSAIRIYAVFLNTTFHWSELAWGGSIAVSSLFTNNVKIGMEKEDISP